MAKPSEYSSLEEKSKFFGHAKDGGKEFLINSKAHFDRFLEEHTAQKRYGNYVYRGLNNARHKLYTTGQRFWIINEIENQGFGYQEFIEKILKLVRTENHETISKYFLSTYKVSADDIALLSYIQHFGGPTPLIDFTKNFKVALYFACRSNSSFESSDDPIDNYISIYIASLLFDTETMRGAAFWYEPWRQLKAMIEELSKADQDKMTIGLRNVDTFFQSLKEFPVSFIDQTVADLIQSNYITNTNILNQDGVFFFVNDPTRPMDELINAHFNTGLLPTSQTKFVNCMHIHKNLIPYIFHKISNIEEEFIFPNAYTMVRNACNRVLL